MICLCTVNLRNSRIIRSYDCDIDHYLLGAKVTERSVSKHEMQTFEVERINLFTLNDPEVNEEYHVKTQTRLQLCTPSVIVCSVKRL
jgi:hypothetical protein